MTQYGKQTVPAYDSPVKIVGDNVTEKDYEDFWEAFRKESTADMLPWFLWGNSPDDTTTMLERGVLPFVYEAYEEKKKHS